MSFFQGVTARLPRNVVGGFELGHVLGVGGFGKVFLGIDRNRKRQVAIKVMDKQVIKKQKLMAYVEREIEMLRSMSHPHIVKLLKVVDTEESFFFNSGVGTQRRVV